MTREEAIQIVQKLLKTNRLDGTGLSQVWDFLKQPITLADFLGWEEGQEYEYRSVDILMLDNGKLYYKSDKCSSGWCNYTFFGNEIEELRQAKKVEPKLKAYHVKDEYSFKELQKELESKGFHKNKAQEHLPADYFKDNNCIYVYVENEMWQTSNLKNLPMGRYIIEYHKVEPRYLLQTDLVSENGVQYLSFDKRRRKYFMGALMISKNVQQKFTDSEISKIKSITRFVEFCEKVEVEE